MKVKHFLPISVVRGFRGKDRDSTILDNILKENGPIRSRVVCHTTSDYSQSTPPPKTTRTEACSGSNGEEVPFLADVTVTTVSWEETDFMRWVTCFVFYRIKKRGQGPSFVSDNRTIFLTSLRAQISGHEVLGGRRRPV